MDDKEALTRLRSLVYQGDCRGLVTVLSEEPWPADSLQLIGDGLLAAVSDGIDGAPEVARPCVNALGERSWEGDRELAVAWKRLSATARPCCSGRCRWTWRSSP